MARDIVLSSLLLPKLAHVPMGSHEFSFIVEELRKLADEMVSRFIEHHADYAINWKSLLLFEFPDSTLSSLADRLSTGSEDLEYVIDGIRQTLQAREEFRNSLAPAVLEEALNRNAIRSQLEEEVGGSLNDCRHLVHKWAKREDRVEEMQKFFDGFFMKRDASWTGEKPDTQPILMAAIEADRII